MDIFKTTRRRSAEKLNCEGITRKEEKEELQYQEMLDCAEKSANELIISNEKVRESKANADKAETEAELAKEKVKSERCTRLNETAQTVIKGVAAFIPVAGSIILTGMIHAHEKESELSLSRTGEDCRKTIYSKLNDLFMKK